MFTDHSSNHFDEFKIIKALLTSGKLLQGNPQICSDQYLEIYDFEKALVISRTNTLQSGETWLDYRSHEAAETKAYLPHLKLSLVWEEKMYDEIESHLPIKFADCFNDVEADLYHAYVNSFFDKKNAFYSELLTLYENGYWPCGFIEENLSAKKIVIFNSKL